MSTSGWRRWWPLTGVVFVALWLAAIFVIGDDVDTHDSDAKILAYYADSGNRARHFAAFFLILASTLVFVWFLAKLRDRLAQAEGKAGTLTGLAFGGGLVASGLWVIAASFFTGPAATIEDTGKFRLDPNTYRIVSDVGYGIWFSGTTIAAVLVVATSLLALRTGLLPKWLAWLGFPVALTLLVAFFFVPFFIFLGWTLVVSALLVWKDRPAPPVVAAA